MTIRVLRLIEYEFPHIASKDLHEMTSSVPFNGSKRFGNVKIRSAVIEYPEKEDDETET